MPPWRDFLDEGSFGNEEVLVVADVDHTAVGPAAALKQLGALANVEDQWPQHLVREARAALGVEVGRPGLSFCDGRLQERGYRVAVAVVSHDLAGDVEHGPDDIGIHEASQLDPAELVEMVDLLGRHWPERLRPEPRGFLDGVHLLGMLTAHSVLITRISPARCGTRRDRQLRPLAGCMASPGPTR